MTDRFVVPEPSEEAQRAHNRFAGGDGEAHAWDRKCLRAAYTVDVPRLVRQEVERALNALRFCDDGTGAAYLSARFPEAAPETRCMGCGEETDGNFALHNKTCRAIPGSEYLSSPTPSAPAEPKPTITVTPEVCGGAPCLAGTRLTTEVVAERAEAETVKGVALDYGISPNAVLAAIAFERDYGAPAVLGCDKCGDTLERNDEHPGYVKPCANCFSAAPPSEAPAKEICGEMEDTRALVCTLSPGHTGDHEAWGVRECLLKWAAARPEAYNPIERCSACACPRCADKDAFVRAVAEGQLKMQTVSPELQAAARKVGA